MEVVVQRTGMFQVMQMKRLGFVMDVIRKVWQYKKHHIMLIKIVYFRLNLVEEWIMMMFDTKPIMNNVNEKIIFMVLKLIFEYLFINNFLN